MGMRAIMPLVLSARRGSFRSVGADWAIFNGIRKVEPNYFTPLKFLVSDRRIEEEVYFNLALKWLVGLAIDESPPDSSGLTCFRNRLGEERFTSIFNQIVETAREKGLVSDRLSIVDSTDVKAEVDTFKIKDNPEASPDKDARHGYKGEKKPFPSRYRAGS